MGILKTYKTIMNYLEKGCKYFGWQGGTIHELRKEIVNHSSLLAMSYSPVMVKKCGGMRQAVKHALHTVISDIIMQD